MARSLSSERCEVTFYDKLSDSRITLFYRLPTTEEQIKYTNSHITRRGKNIESTLGESRIAGGLKIMTGFKDGAFEDDKGKLISSDPQSGDYRPDWKELVHKYAPDIIARLAMHVYEASLELVDDGDEDPT